MCEKGDGLAVHVLTCERDVREAFWALRSFHHFSGLRPPLFVHDDGSLTPRSRERLLEHFVDVSIVGREEADERMRQLLRDLPESFRYRFTEFCPHALKLFDANLLGGKTLAVFLMASERVDRCTRAHPRATAPRAVEPGARAVVDEMDAHGLIE